MEANTRELYSAETASELIAGLVRARVLSAAICAVAELGVADLIADGSMAVSDLASATASREEQLYRLLRCLAAAGVFRETNDKVFENTALSEPLRASSPMSFRAGVLLDSQPWFTRTIDGLIHSVRTGDASFDKICGMSWVEYFRVHPESAAVFNAGMAAWTELELRLLDRYDFSWAQRVAEVGGGIGAFLAGVLQRNPRVWGILGELSEVVEPARQNLARQGLLGRCEIVAIDMFQTIPFKADACVLKRVIHDWPDADAITVLAHCRDVVAPTGRVIVIEPVVTGFFSALTDLVMMTVGGRERTREDLDRLFSAAGLRVSRVLDISPLVSLVEGTCA